MEPAELKHFFTEVREDGKEIGEDNGETAVRILTVSIFSFLLSWTDYTFGLIILSSDIQKTLPIGLATMLGAGDLNWGEIMAGAFLISVPLLIMLVFLSKYFVKGLTAGAIKG